MKAQKMNLLDRIQEDYNTHGNLIVAFDFDNTVYDYHGVGLDCSDVVDLLLKCQALGFTLCLFTANSAEKLEWCVQYLKETYQLLPDFVNEGPILQENRKPYYNILLDDRAGLPYTFKALEALVQRIRS